MQFFGSNYLVLRSQAGKRKGMEHQRLVNSDCSRMIIMMSPEGLHFYSKGLRNSQPVKLHQ
jgi:hypothetical protein